METANGNTMILQNSESYSIYKKGIWLYIILLIFEGALRKWILPSLATPLLLVRDPIAIWLVIEGWRKGWIDVFYAKVMMMVATLSFILTLLFGHQNILVALYGWRIYFFHFPMIFIIGKILTRDDILRICRFFLYVSIPMTVLVVIQFYSPPTAWVNIGVGGEGTAGFGAVGNFMRPPGVFSFTAGYVAFQGVVGCILLYYLIMNKSLYQKYQIQQWLIITASICYLVALPTSISRTNFFQTLVFLAFAVLAAVVIKNIRPKVITLLCIGAGILILLTVSGLIATNIEVFMARFEGANEVEGGFEGVVGNRYIGGFLRALTRIDVPVSGYGIGLGTNAGASLMGGDMYSFGFNAEVEWERIIGECGFFLGVSIIAIRLALSIAMLFKSFKRLTENLDLLPWILCAGMILYLPQAQWGSTTSLGFTVLLGGLTLAAIRTSHEKVTI